MASPQERLVERIAEIEGLVLGNKGTEISKDAWLLLQSLLTPRPQSRGRPPSFVTRETNFNNEIKDRYITDLHFGFLETHSPALRHRLIQHIELLHVPAGEFVYRCGEKVNACFFLLLGKIQIFATGTPQPVQEISEGTSFGHGRAFAGDLPRMASMLATMPVVVGKLRFPDFNNVASETPDNDARYLRRLIGTIKPFATLAEKDYPRILPIIKVARLTAEQTISVQDKVVILCKGQVYGFAYGDKFPAFHCDRKFLIPAGLLHKLVVVSPTALICVMSLSKFRATLVSDIAVFYEHLQDTLLSKFDAVHSLWSNMCRRPDFSQKVNQCISDITAFVRQESAIAEDDLPSVSHAAWVTALRRIDETCATK